MPKIDFFCRIKLSAKKIAEPKFFGKIDFYERQRLPTPEKVGSLFRVEKF